MARKHGSGNVEQRGSGWRWRLRVNGRLVCSRSYPTKEEAERVLVEAVRQIHSGDLLPAAGLTLRQWGARWLMTRDNRNHKTDAGRWQLHIEQSALASMPLKTITAKSIQLLLTQLQRTPSAKGGTLSVQTVRHCLNLLRSCLAAAVAEDLLVTNPAEGLRVVSPPSSTETWTYLTEAEIAAVLQLQEQPARTAYAVAIFAGLRQGELLGLHWQDVDLGARPQLTVRYSHGGPTKSGKIRRVPLLARRYRLACWMCSVWMMGSLGCGGGLSGRGRFFST